MTVMFSPPDEPHNPYQGRLLPDGISVEQWAASEPIELNDTLREMRRLVVRRFLIGHYPQWPPAIELALMRCIDFAYPVWEVALPGEGAGVARDKAYVHLAPRPNHSEEVPLAPPIWARATIVKPECIGIAPTLTIAGHAERRTQRAVRATRPVAGLVGRAAVGLAAPDNGLMARCMLVGADAIDAVGLRPALVPNLSTEPITQPGQLLRHAADAREAIRRRWPQLADGQGHAGASLAVALYTALGDLLAGRQYTTDLGRLALRNLCDVDPALAIELMLIDQAARCRKELVEEPLGAAVLTIQSGRFELEKHLADPFEPLRLGPEETSDCTIERVLDRGANWIDIMWDGVQLHFDCVGDDPWIIVRGKRRMCGVISVGDEFQLGGTTILLRRERLAAAALTSTGASSGGTAEADSWLRPRRQNLFVLFDAARGQALLLELERSRDAFDRLYDGLPGRAMAHVAPYLVSLDLHSRLYDRLLAGWGQGEVVWLSADVSLEALRRHLRRFLIVTGADGQDQHFRFYDPRALAEFWPLASDTQRQHLIGPAEWLALEAGDGHLQVLRRPHDQLPTRIERMVLSAEQTAGLNQLHRQRVLTRMQRELHTFHAEALTALDAPLQHSVSRLLALAEHYQIDREAEATLFARMLLTLGLDAAERLPWFTEVVTNPDYAPVGKVRALWDAAHDNDMPFPPSLLRP